MKWYYAILLTLAILVFGVWVASYGNTDANRLVELIIGLTAIWAAARSASFGWGLFVFFLWPLGFPWFLISRYKP